MHSPAELLPRLLRQDPATPRITVYDDTCHPPERIELSARVLSNWVAKAANLLSEEYDAGPGTRVLLDLPPHWRTAYWACAIWAVGGSVVLPGPDPAPGDVVVTDRLVEPDRLGTTLGVPVVRVTLPALARRAVATVAPGELDEAAELSTYPDQFEAYTPAEEADPGLVLPTGVLSHGEVVTWALQHAGDPGQPARVHHRVRPDGRTQASVEFLAATVAAWAREGSLVVTRGDVSEQVLAQRLAEEGVTALGGIRWSV